MEELKEGWKRVKLSEFINFNPRETLKKNTVAKYIEMANLQCFSRAISGYEEKEYKGGTKFKNGDTLLARITPCLQNGKTAYINCLEENEIAFGSTEYIVLREKQYISDRKFIYYLAISNDFRELAIKSMTGTSGRQRVQTDMLINVELNLPPLETQEKIASILSSLDDKIELNNEMNKTLEEMAQTLFKRWFIDFEFPNENGEPYKTSGGKMIDSELGEIPEGWEVGNLEKLVDNFDAKRKPLSKKERDCREKKYPYYGAAGVIDYVDSYLFDGEYILLGEDGTVITNEGSPILNFIDEKFWVSNHAHVIKAKEKLSNDFIYYLLKNTNVSHIVTGAVQPKINQKNLNGLKILIPETKKISEFGILVSYFTKILRNNSSEIQSLIQIRDTLLPKLMNGEVEV
ncbi:MAG: restriction endonuclease subunit S [Cetobacterium sp.]